MSKFLTISVVIEFSDEVNKHEEINQISKNIAQAIANEVNLGEGIAPDSSEFFTKTIYTSSPITGEEFIINI